MGERDLVQLESELHTTETLQLAASLYLRSNRWRMNWQSENLHPERRFPCFWKKVMKGSLHHLPQSVICIPTHFMQEHPDTFQQGNLITLEGRSGNTWKVRATGKPILHSGWRAFAHDHGLCEGDELCFTLTQPLHFVVDILNCHGVLKESAFTATNTGKYSVASVCFPYEYVHRPRKRKVRKISVRNHEDSGYDVTTGAATIASRCKTIARERFGGYPSYPNMPRFCRKRKQWECRQEKDGREVVTILDSDEDDENDEKRLLDHMELSFGSAQVQGHRMGNTQQLVAYVKHQGECVLPPRSNPTPATAKGLKKVATQSIPAAVIGGHGEDLKVAENVDSFHPELTTNQPQASPAEDTTMSNEEGDVTPLANLEKSESGAVQLGVPPENNLSADSKSRMFQSHTIPTPPLEEKHKSVRIVGPLTDKADLLPPTQSLQVVTPVVTSGGEYVFAALQNFVEMPATADTIMDPMITEHPAIPPESVLTNHELIENLEPDHPKTGPKESTKEILQLSPPTKFDKRREFPVNGKPVLKLPCKTSTTACVLKSKRIPVAKLHRAQTLLAAQALTKKLRSPAFMAVMTNSNVYTDFSLDIPGEFRKKSRLPVGEARVTLVCDEVPTMSKAIWIGTNPEQPKLDADTWMEFSRSHFLEEGDVCVFELFNRVTIRIGIHIFRVVGLRRSGIPEHWTEHYNVVHLDAHTPAATLARAAAAELKI